jgi:hypothetical protein
MSSNTQPIQFLLHQLATNKQGRARFNLFIKDKLGFNFQIIKGKLFAVTDTRQHGGILTELPAKKLYDSFTYFEKVCFIRTCLIRVNGEAFWECLKRQIKEKAKIDYWKGENGDFLAILFSAKPYIITTLDDLLYKAFDKPLRTGKPLDESIQALHEKMLELVPEYQKFIFEFYKKHYETTNIFEEAFPGMSGAEIERKFRDANIAEKKEIIRLIKKIASLKRLRH